MIQTPWPELEDDDAYRRMNSARKGCEEREREKNFQREREKKKMCSECCVVTLLFRKTKYRIGNTFQKGENVRVFIDI